MGDVISLNRYRKDRRKRDGNVRTAVNRLRFGRTKAERQAEGAEAERQATQLDQKRLAGPDRQDGAEPPAKNEEPRSE